MPDRKTISILGCGWLGYPLAVSLLQEGYTVKGSTTSTPKLAVLDRAGISPYLLRIQAESSEPQLGDFLKCDTLIVSFPPRMRQQGAGIYLNALEMLSSAVEQSPVHTIIFLSSTSVYPNNNAEVTEDMVSEPESESGNALLKAESLFLGHTKQETIVLRMAGLVGYERHPGRFLAGKKGLPNGKERINLIHRDDCIRIISHLLATNSGRNIFNCCSDTHPLKKDFYTEAAIRAKLEPPVFQKKGNSAYKIVSNKKLKAQLNYDFLYGDLGRFNWP